MKNKLCVSSNRVSTGIDIVSNDDAEEFANELPGIVFTQSEYADIAISPNRIQRAAGKFAGKEAIMKALGHGIDEIELIDIEILKNNFGKPTIFLSGSALSFWRQSRFNQLDVSISHHREYTLGIAVAIELRG